MTQNDNFRYYYGQSLINKDTVNEYKSILDYIVAHGGSGSEIDADMLDGHHSTDFLLIEDSENYMKPGFYIGYTPIENQSQMGYQFLYTRDIKLPRNSNYLYMFREDNNESSLKVENLYQQLLDNGSALFNEAKTRYEYDGDWELDHTAYLLNAGLCDLELAINCLLEYEQKNNAELNQRIDDLQELTFETEDFDKLQYILEHYLVDCRLYDENGNITGETETVLDAGAVNGLRFFLVTQQQYDQYPEAIKQNPRYIFIIRDEIPTGYVTPTTISTNSFKPLFKSDGYYIYVSIDYGKTYYEAGKLYQFNENDEGFIPMYVGGETLPTLLADPLLLNDNFFINGAWMRNFLGGDPNTTDTLEDIIDAQTAGLRSQVERLSTQINNLDNTYELQANKITDELTSSTTQYPSSYVVMNNVMDLRNQINELKQKLGLIDNALISILGTGID